MSSKKPWYMQTYADSLGEALDADDRIKTAKEVCVTTTPKRAALLFDRVYHPLPIFSDDKIPWEVTIGYPLAITLNPEIHELADPLERQVPFFTKTEELDPRVPTFLKSTQSTASYKDENNEPYEILFIRDAVNSFLKRGIDSFPLLNTDNQFIQYVHIGSLVAYQAALQYIPVLDEEDLSWEQVLEFRKDKHTLKKYRSLRFWLNHGLKAKSIGEACEIIEKKVEDYVWALQKHGVRTKIGAISSILNTKAFTAISTSAGIAGVLGGEIFAALTAGLLTASKVSIWIAERSLERKEIEHMHSHIALIYDAKRRFGEKKRNEAR